MPFFRNKSTFPSGARQEIKRGAKRKARKEKVDFTQTKKRETVKKIKKSKDKGVKFMAKRNSSGGGFGRFFAILLALIIGAGVVMGFVYREHVGVIWNKAMNFLGRVDDEVKQNEANKDDDKLAPLRCICVAPCWRDWYYEHYACFGN